MNYICIIYAAKIICFWAKKPLTMLSCLTLKASFLGTGLNFLASNPTP